MHKVLLLLSLCTSAVFAATYQVRVYNNDRSKSFTFKAYNSRGCFCIKNTQTGFIRGIDGGDIKLFSTTDCTGNYSTLGSNSERSNAQWVNSFSFGQSGVPSDDPQGHCPNWYTIL
ncbi:MAG: hypothetical protein J3Q66DRAFT_361649, partial [Benniella sp.]